MRALSKDLSARGVTVILLHPGWVSTDMGGTQAPVTPAQSARGIADVLASVDPGDSGSFLDWKGEPVPW